MRRWAQRTHLAALLVLAVAACARREHVPVRGGIAVTDDAGRQVTLVAPARRIVSLLPSFTEILFAIGELKKMQPNADYDHLTMVGHSNGGDISMFFAQQHPELVRRVVTLDNLRVPFVTDDKALKILSFRSHDPHFQTDPGVLPTDKGAKEAGIDIVKTEAQHTDMSDRGPDRVKESIQNQLDKFLSDSASSELSPVDTSKPLISDPRAMGP